MNNFAKQLRQTMTDAEQALWYQLWNRRFGKVKFRRQHVIEKYVADFYCAEKRIVIEIDGGQHSWKESDDRLRSEWLAEQGCRVVRFWNNDVLRNMSGVLAMIEKMVGNPHPAPLP